MKRGVGDMFCAKCGKELDDNAQGCPYCGAVVSQQQEKKRGIGSKIVGAIVILLLFGGCGALYWYDNGGKQEIELYEAQQMMKQGKKLNHPFQLYCGLVLIQMLQQ